MLIHHGPLTELRRSWLCTRGGGVDNIGPHYITPSLGGTLCVN